MEVLQSAAGAVHAVLLGSKVGLEAVIPETPAFCLYWAGLGFLSCCVFGCGGAHLLLHLLPFLESASSESSTLAVLCYGFGSVVGEIPCYYVSTEMFSTTRNKLRARRHPDKFLTAVYDTIGPSSPGASYVFMLLLNALNPLPIDIAAHICGAFGLALSDYTIPAVLGKAVLRPYAALYVYKHSTRLMWVLDHKGSAPSFSAEILLIGVLVAAALHTLWFRCVRYEAPIELEE